MMLLGVSLSVQAIAATYFIVDGIDDVLTQIGTGVSLELIMECTVAAALLLAVVVGAHQLRRAIEDARLQNEALQAARGSMSVLLTTRFQQWQLSRAEADVALFALKGCSITQIAGLRNSAEGTVRSQLSQIYAKAGVTSQSALIAHFIEELL